MTGTTEGQVKMQAPSWKDTNKSFKGVSMQSHQANMSPADGGLASQPRAKACGIPRVNGHEPPRAMSAVGTLGTAGVVHLGSSQLTVCRGHGPEEMRPCV